MLTPFVRIGPDGTVTVIVKHLDKGQGSATGLATLVADDLDASWDQVAVDFAPANAALYNNLGWGPIQGTGGSFGRRAIYDSHYAAEAASIAKAWGKPQPIKLPLAKGGLV